MAVVALKPFIVAARWMDSPKVRIAACKASTGIALAQIIPTSYITDIGTPTNASAGGGAGGYSMDGGEEA